MEVISITSPPIDRNKQIQFCLKCSIIIHEPIDEFSVCNHNSSITLELTGFDHGTGVECMERDCAFNGIGRSPSELSRMLIGHAERHKKS